LKGKLSTQHSIATMHNGSYVVRAFDALDAYCVVDFPSSVPSTCRGRRRFVTAFSRLAFSRLAFSRHRVIALPRWTFRIKIPIFIIVTSFYFRCQLTGMFRVCTRCNATYTRASCFVKWFGPNWLELDRLLGMVVNGSVLFARLQPYALRVLTLSRSRVDSPRHAFRSVKGVASPFSKLLHVSI